MAEHSPNFLTNFRGGLTGVFVYPIITIVVFFAGFMAAFGNPTPTAEAILRFLEFYFTVASPLWGIPIAYILGSYFLRGGKAESSAAAR